MTRERDKKMGREQRLLDAARLGQVDQMEMILAQMLQVRPKKRSNPLASLRKGIGLNDVRDPVTGFTCLHHAALNGHSMCVHLLLESGAKLNAVDYKGSSALHLAAWAGNLQVVRQLISYSLKLISVQSVLQDGEQRGTAREQQQQQLDIDLCNNDNQTPISLAAQYGHCEVVAELLAHSASVQLRNSQLESPLDLACLNGRVETVRLLLDAVPQLALDLQRSHSTIRISAQVSSDGFSSNVNKRKQSTESSDVAGHSGERVQTRGPIISGWSSLLRNRSSKTSQQQQELKLSSFGSSTHKNELHERRASLSIKDQFKSQVADESASSTTVQQRLNFAHSQQLSLDSRSAHERLLDHSPLHLAVRRCHLNVVHLLLRQYRANVMQLSSQGSVLHELALSCRGPSGGLMDLNTAELLSAIIDHLIFITDCDYQQIRALWSRLLSLRNSKHQTVLESLAQMHSCNRKAQELESLIHETSEHLARHPEGQAQNQQQVGCYTTHAAGSLATIARQRGSQTRGLPMPLPGQQSSRGAFIGTQTIDRRHTTRALTSKLHLNASTQSFNATDQFAQQQVLTQPRRQWQQVQENYPHSAEILPHITRSTSNLDDQRTQLNWCEEEVSTKTQCLLYEPIQEQYLNLKSTSSGHKLVGPHLDSINPLTKQQQQPANVAQNSPVSMGATNEFRHVKQQATIPVFNGEVNQDEIDYTSGLASSMVTNQLVRSNTDCSHQLSKLFPSQTTAQAQVDMTRNAKTTMEAREPMMSSSHQQRNENSSLTSLNAASQLTNNQNYRSATLDRRTINRRYHVYDREFYPPRLVSTARMTPGPSAQLRGDWQRQAVAVVPPLEREHKQVEQQMNRFVGRQSRMTDDLALPLHVNTTLDQNDGDRRACATNLATSSTNFHASHSFDSHLSGAPHQDRTSFDLSRHRLMRDFNRMLGLELGLKGSQFVDSIDRTEGSIGGECSGSRHSIMTGVSLDMDTRGERLTVSGTRITLSGDRDLSTVSFDDSSAASLAQSPKSSLHEPAVIDTNGAHLIQSDSSHGVLFASNRKMVPCMTPQKPPRPSIRSQQEYKRLNGASSSSRGDGKQGTATKAPSNQNLKLEMLAKSSLPDGEIYDMPSTNNSLDPMAGTQIVRINSPNSTETRMSTPSLCGPRFGVSNTRSITNAPRVPPPPPPKLLNAPTPISTHLAANSSSDTLSFNESIANNCRQQQESQLQALSPSVTRRPLQTSGLNQTDIDSGVCTSNSPASLSQDLEPLKGCPRTDSSHEELTRHSTASHDLNLSRDASGGPTFSSTSSIDGCDESPPSPHTAQMSIDEMFKPLSEKESTTRMQEMANQTDNSEAFNLDGDTSTPRLERTSLTNQIDSIFNCLHRNDGLHSVKSTKVGSDSVTSHENCMSFHNRSQRARCRSISNSFNEPELKTLSPLANVKYNITPGNVILLPSAGSRAMASKYSLSCEDEDDYAATSEVSSSSSSNTEVECSSNESKSNGTTKVNLDREDDEHCTSLPLIKKCKEVTLNVVAVDEGRSSDSCDEIFYLDPTELRKVAACGPTSRPLTVDAETLTDEDLLASVDKTAGYIRFTLKKRRNSQASTTVTTATGQLDSRGRSTSYEFRPNNMKPEIKSKRTRAMNESENLPELEKNEYCRVRSAPKNGSMTSKNMCLSSQKEQVKQVKKNIELKSTGRSSESLCDLQPDSTTLSNPVRGSCKLVGASSPENQQQISSRKDSSGSVQMDISQASTSSDSTELSIKSIVSLNQQSTRPGLVHDESGGLSVEVSHKPMVSPESPRLHRDGMAETSSAPHVGSLLIRETARKSEAPTEVDENFQQRPVAATRRTVRANIVEAKTATYAPPTASNQCQNELNETNPNGKENSLIATSALTSTSPPAPIRRTICWPPKQRCDEEMKLARRAADMASKPAVVLERTPPDRAAPLGQVAANRISFQKLIEQSNKSNQKSAISNRPKPQPPIKPAGLIGGKFKVGIE